MISPTPLSLTRPNNLGHPYDEVADKYDRIWSDPEALKQDRLIMQRLAYREGDVLDIGCGTGLFLDHHPLCSNYLGIDPSQSMLDQLRLKHSSQVICRTFEACLPELLNADRRFDLIISMFGSPSYIPPAFLQSIPELLAPYGRVFMMFIAPGYTPITHDFITDPPDLIEHDFSDYGSVSTFDNYVVTER